MKYFLKGCWQNEYTEVTKEQFIDAERKTDFFHDDDDEDTATDDFDMCGINGKVKHEDGDYDKEDDYKCF